MRFEDAQSREYRDHGTPGNEVKRYITFIHTMLRVSAGRSANWVDDASNGAKIGADERKRNAAEYTEREGETFLLLCGKGCECSAVIRFWCTLSEETHVGHSLVRGALVLLEAQHGILLLVDRRWNHSFDHRKLKGQKPGRLVLLTLLDLAHCPRACSSVPAQRRRTRNQSERGKHHEEVPPLR
jgi:hypothetical protein